MKKNKYKPININDLLTDLNQMICLGNLDKEEGLKLIKDAWEIFKEGTTK